MLFGWNGEAHTVFISFSVQRVTWADGICFRVIRPLIRVSHAAQAVQGLWFNCVIHVTWVMCWGADWNHTCAVEVDFWHVDAAQRLTALQNWQNKNISIYNAIFRSFKLLLIVLMDGAGSIHWVCCLLLETRRCSWKLYERNYSCLNSTVKRFVKKKILTHGVVTIFFQGFQQHHMVFSSAQ